jgi:hypothetical protein
VEVERSGGFGAAVGRLHHRLTDGPPTTGRRVLVWILLALALILILAASLTLWVERQVLNTDNWVETSSELLADDEVRALVASDLVDALFAQQDVEQRIASRLPPQLEGLAAPAAGLVRQAAVPAAENLLERPRVQELWANANRLAQSKLVAVLRGNEGGVITTGGGEVVLDLGELVQRLADELGLDVQVADDAGQVQIADSDQLAAAQDAVKVIDALSVLILIAVFVLLIVAVYLAAGFRRETLRGIAIGLILVGLILLVVQRLVGNALIDNLTTEVTRPAGVQVWAIGTALLRDICIALIAYGIVLLLGVLLAGPTRPARWIRRKLAPTLRERPWLAYGVVGLAFLLVLLWGPTEATRRIVGLIILAVLVGLGVWALRRETLREFPPPPPGAA